MNYLRKNYNKKKVMTTLRFERTLATSFVLNMKFDAILLHWM